MTFRKTSAGNFPIGTRSAPDRHPISIRQACITAIPGIPLSPVHSTQDSQIRVIRHDALPRTLWPWRSQARRRAHLAAASIHGDGELPARVPTIVSPLCPPCSCVMCAANLMAPPRPSLSQSTRGSLRVIVGNARRSACRRQLRRRPRPRPGSPTGTATIRPTTTPVGRMTTTTTTILGRR